MARNRMLNPDFWTDEEIAALSPHARLLYMGLWGICDDNHATLPNRPEWIRVQIFPYEQVDISILLVELESIGKVIKFDHDGKEWWFIKNFFKHQKVDRPSREKYPKFRRTRSTLDEYSTSPRHELSNEVKELNKGRLNLEVPQTLSPPKSVSKSLSDKYRIK